MNQIVHQEISMSRRINITLCKYDTIPRLRIYIIHISRRNLEDDEWIEMDGALRSTSRKGEIFHDRFHRSSIDRVAIGTKSEPMNVTSIRIAVAPYSVQRREPHSEN